MELGIPTVINAEIKQFMRVCHMNGLRHCAITFINCSSESWLFPMVTSQPISGFLPECSTLHLPVWGLIEFLRIRASNPKSTRM